MSNKLKEFEKGRYEILHFISDAKLDMLFDKIKSDRKTRIAKYNNFFVQFSSQTDSFRLLFVTYFFSKPFAVGHLPFDNLSVNAVNQRLNRGREFYPLLLVRMMAWPVSGLSSTLHFLHVASYQEKIKNQISHML